MECEYSLQCLGEKAEYACVAPGNHQECAQYREFSVKEKTRRIHGRLTTLYKADDATICDAINNMGR
jgi:hypothetical protein